MSSGSSRTEVWKRVSISSASRRSARNALFESTISPRRSSSPIVRISAVTRAPPASAATSERRARARARRARRPRDRRASPRGLPRSAARPSATGPGFHTSNTRNATNPVTTGEPDPRRRTRSASPAGEERREGQRAGPRPRRSRCARSSSRPARSHEAPRGPDPGREERRRPRARGRRPPPGLGRSESNTKIATAKAAPAVPGAPRGAGPRPPTVATPKASRGGAAVGGAVLAIRLGSRIGTGGAGGAAAAGGRSPDGAREAQPAPGRAARARPAQAAARENAGNAERIELPCVQGARDCGADESRGPAPPPEAVRSKSEAMTKPRASAATEGIPPERTPSETTALLVELGRAVKARSLLRGRASPRCGSCSRAPGGACRRDLRRYGALEIEAAPAGLRVPASRCACRTCSSAGWRSAWPSAACATLRFDGGARRDGLAQLVDWLAGRRRGRLARDAFVDGARSRRRARLRAEPDARSARHGRARGRGAARPAAAPSRRRRRPRAAAVELAPAPVARSPRQRPPARAPRRDGRGARGRAAAVASRADRPSHDCRAAELAARASTRPRRRARSACRRRARRPATRASRRRVRARRLVAHARASRRTLEAARVGPAPTSLAERRRAPSRDRPRAGRRARRRRAELRFEAERPALDRQRRDAGLHPTPRVGLEDTDTEAVEAERAAAIALEDGEDGRDGRAEEVELLLRELADCEDDFQYHDLARRAEILATALADEGHGDLGVSRAGALRAPRGRRRQADAAPARRRDGSPAAARERARGSPSWSTAPARPHTESSLEATQVLLRLGSSVVPMLFRAAEREADPNRRGQLHGILIAMGEAALPELMRAFESREPVAVRAAARLAGELQSPRACRPLAALLEGAGGVAAPGGGEGAGADRRRARDRRPRARARERGRGRAEPRRVLPRRGGSARAADALAERAAPRRRPAPLRVRDGARARRSGGSGARSRAASSPRSSRTAGSATAAPGAISRSPRPPRSAASRATRRRRPRRGRAPRDAHVRRAAESALERRASALSR